ncbi:MAG: YidC/Oxa1 family membrane protein insertase, partial [Gemmataceae bacterium]|nr:YidC/Oxa1 family membrane protein insertase [Gemmataceae bacterium]
KLALDIRTGSEAEATHALWEDDVTVRVNTQPEDLRPGARVVHSYTLYNGPVKPLLLSYLTGEKRVDAAVVSHYGDELKLNTMIDYQSASFWYYTGWTWLVVSVTNLLHWLLNTLYYAVPNLGLCIILLTVLVRGLMFPLSRKQALMGIRMQALAPEMKKLQEKYKDSADRSELAYAQLALYKKHGVNPVGSCWVMLLQMPVFLGLYYALQESITFRLGSFWPTWIENLAAPDMMFPWGRSVPMLTADSSYGGFLYLGPYFNILPIIAVALMMVQQQMMTPPPTDEQQEMNQKIMKWMMIFFGLMFYRVAAGLCIYYIASTLWGFAERQLLPKAESDKLAADARLALVADAPAGAIRSADAGGIVNSGKKKNKKKSAKEREQEKKEADAPKGIGQRLSDWWNDVLDKAKKK